MQLNIKHPGTVDEVTALRTLFEEYLRQVYWTERALAPAFTNLITYISSKDIVKMLTEHLSHTLIQTNRLERIFESIGIPPDEKKFDAIDSLINEADVLIGQTVPGAVRDAAIIANLQHIIHCEIASYGTLKSFAFTLKEEDVVGMLEQSLQEEKDLDLKLSVIAEAYINDEAANKEF